MPKKKTEVRYQYGAVKAVAELCGVTPEYVSQIKNNRQDPATEKARAVREALKKFVY